MNEDVEVMLFRPDGLRDLRRMYPELNGVTEFKGLTNREMVFIWYYSNRTSPNYNNHLKEIDKIKSCFDKAFSGKKFWEEEMDYNSGILPERIRKGCKKMEEYDIDVRLRAKMMVNKILKRFDETVNIDTSSFIDDEGILDIARKKAHIDACSKIAEKLPELIAQIEHGYGVDSVDGKDLPDDMSAIKYYHSKLND